MRKSFLEAAIGNLIFIVLKANAFGNCKYVNNKSTAF